MAMSVSCKEPDQQDDGYIPNAQTDEMDLMDDDDKIGSKRRQAVLKQEGKDDAGHN